MRNDHHHDGIGECQCHANLYPVGTLLRGSHPGNFAYHFAEQHHGDMESFDDQHGFSRFNGLYLYPIGRTMCDDDYHDGSGECQCHANLYPVGTLLRGSYPGNFTDHFAEQYNRYLESVDDQHCFCWIYGLYIYPFRRAMRYHCHHDHCG
jgi:hypothetical protein